jgi:hypothetical protein
MFGEFSCMANSEKDQITITQRGDWGILNKKVAFLSSTS